MMLAKTAFALRSLLVVSFLGGLVACTFDQPADEHDKSASSAIHNGKDKSADAGSSKGHDASASDDDRDASVINTGADGGTGADDRGVDAGPYDADGGTDDVDGGAYGDDDDDVDGGAGEWGVDGGAW